MDDTIFDQQNHTIELSRIVWGEDNWLATHVNYVGSETLRIMNMDDMPDELKESILDLCYGGSVLTLVGAWQTQKHVEYVPELVELLDSDVIDLGLRTIINAGLRAYAESKGGEAGGKLLSITICGIAIKTLMLKDDRAALDSMIESLNEAVHG